VNNFGLKFSQYLQKINVCEMNDRWFMVDEAYLLSVFNSILYELRIAKQDLNEIRYPEILTKYGVYYLNEIFLIINSQ